MGVWRSKRDEWVKSGGNGPLIMVKSKKMEDHIEYLVAFMQFEHRRVEALELMENFGYTKKQLNAIHLGVVTKLPPSEPNAKSVRGIKVGYEEKPKKKQPEIAIPPPPKSYRKREGIRVVVRCANSGSNLVESQLDVEEGIDEKTLLAMAAETFKCKVKLWDAFTPPVPGQRYEMVRVI
jgi:hypothetical protein